mgnify:CR=1 FL=1
MQPGVLVGLNSLLEQNGTITLPTSNRLFPLGRENGLQDRGNDGGPVLLVCQALRLSAAGEGQHCLEAKGIGQCPHGQRPDLDQCRPSQCDYAQNPAGPV